MKVIFNSGESRKFTASSLGLSCVSRLQHCCWVSEYIFQSIHLSVHIHLWFSKPEVWLLWFWLNNKTEIVTWNILIIKLPLCKERYLMSHFTKLYIWRFQILGFSGEFEWLHERVVYFLRFTLKKSSSWNLYQSAYKQEHPLLLCPTQRQTTHVRLVITTQEGPPQINHF